MNDHKSKRVGVEGVLKECLDSEFVAQCPQEIRGLAQALEYHVEHTLAENETVTRCEKEKRLQLEQQLKEALHILDSVRGEIEETKQKHVKVVDRLKVQRGQLREDKRRLSTELANVNNEVARLKLLQQQMHSVDLRIQAVNDNCRHKQHADLSQLRFLNEHLLPQSSRGELEQELSLSRAVLLQQQSNVDTLRKTVSCKTQSTSKDNEPEYRELNENLIGALKSIHSSFKKGCPSRKTSAKNYGGDDVGKKVACLMLQSEQKSIAELNSRMNKHIQTLTSLLNNLSNPGHH